jgi:hypothetical protein
MPSPYTLVARDGCLYIPSTPDEFCEDGMKMLLYVYSAGDCDVCPWPKPERWPEYAKMSWETRLAACIFDCVETGDISERHGEFKVYLPDGTEFCYTDHMN